jgi:hypothetical protein
MTWADTMPAGQYVIRRRSVAATCAAMAAGAAACWGFRALYFWMTRRLRFPPPWYEQLEPLMLPGFALLVVACMLVSRRWPLVGDFAVGACVAAIVFAVCVFVFNGTPG